MVPRGSLAVVLGNSGSGKTTLLRGIMQVGMFPDDIQPSMPLREQIAAWSHVMNPPSAYILSLDFTLLRTAVSRRHAV